MFDLSRRDLLVRRRRRRASAGAPAQAVAQAAGAAARKPPHGTFATSFRAMPRGRAERQSLLKAIPGLKAASGQARPKRGGA